MKAEVKTNPAPGASPDDRPVKVFKVESPWRRCLVCEQRFNPGDAQKHANAPCSPSPAEH
jgi:hypothetical protein